jgi:hypothetical protein
MDKNQSPPGYHEYEEITVTRQVIWILSFEKNIIPNKTFFLN